MVKKGNIIRLMVNTNKPEDYVVTERLDDFGHGEGGWLCVEMEALFEKGVDNITAFDCWRITDKYMETQLQRGIIVIIENSKYES